MDYIQRLINKARPDIWIAIALLGLVCLFFSKFLFATDHFVYNFDISYFYPHETVIRNSLSQNEFPLWNPYFGGGSPQLGKIQVGLLYPPQVLLRTLMSIVPMFNWDAILHVYLAGLGMYLLLRDLAVSRFMSVICAVAFMFSGSIVPRLFAGHVSVIHSFVWIAWLLLVYRRLLRIPSWGNTLLVVMFATFVILGGHPQISLAVLLVPFSYFLVLFVPEQWRNQAWHKLKSGLFYSIVTAVLTFGLLAVQLLPFVDWLGQTSRGQGVVINSLSFMTRHSMNLEHLITPLVPTIWFDASSATSVNLTGNSHFWEISAFVTVTLIVLFVAGFALSKNRWNLLRIYFLGLALFGLFMSMGRLNPLYHILFDVAPIFRGPGRMMVLWTFGITVLAGIYGDEVVAVVCHPEQRRRLRKVAFVLGGILILSVMFAVFWMLRGTAVATRLPNPDNVSVALIQSTVQSSFFIFVLTTFLLAALFWIGQQPVVNINRWKGLLFFIVMAEVMFFAAPLIVPYPVSLLYRDNHPYAQLDLDMGEVRFANYREPPNYLLPTLNHVKNGEEYFAMEVLQGAGFQGELLLSAGFVAESEPITATNYRLVQQAEIAYLYEHEDNLPRIYVVPSIKTVTSHEEALTAVTNPTFDPSSQALVTILDTDEQNETSPSWEGLSESVVYSAKFIEYNANSLTAHIQTDRPGMVVFTEMYYPGWQATIDGESAKIWRANYTFRGVFVDEGNHIIQMNFNPDDFKTGLMITLVTGVAILLVMIGAGILELNRYRREKEVG